MKKISIVLASYNGQDYIHEQINSIINCDGYDELVEEIIVSDDNSTDATLTELRRFSDVKIVINKTTPGVIHNFINGLAEVKTDYVMFCDQDDAWLPNKIAVLYDEMISLELKNTDNKPLLSFSDLKITDNKLNVIHNSFMDYHHIEFSKRRTFEKLILNNIAPGCVCIINKKMKDYMLLSQSYISSWVMHDWWMMLIASSIGDMSFVKQSLILYRQHGNNVVGYKQKSFLNKIINLGFTLNDYRRSSIERVTQHRAFNKFLTILKLDEKAIPDFERDIIFMLKNECSKKRKACAIVNFIRFRFSNIPRG